MNTYNIEFKITRTYGLAGMRSVRWRKRTGWEIVFRIAADLRIPVSEFVIEFSPSIYGDHVEFAVWRWNKITRAYDCTRTA